ncbi:MAG: hypothetical protein IKX85_04855, partial [Clostridia bacterium]|nr:hypothetical protein [Clostridia bacterium]
MRRDGKRVKSDDPIYAVVPYIMPHRYDAMNMITLDIPIDPIQKYRAELRRKGRVVSSMGVLLAAWLRTTREFPLLNRFIANKKIYQRNEYCVGMVVLKSGQDDGTMNKIFFDPDDNIFQVQEKIDAYVSKNREVEEKNSTDKVVKFLLSVPGLVNFGVGVLRFADKHGLLPKKLIDASPFHVSLCISNLASIRTNHIYHHTYEFGTTSLFITMGNMREVAFREKGNEIVFKRCLPLGLVMDERICSGHYFALAFER